MYFPKKILKFITLLFIVMGVVLFKSACVNPKERNKTVLPISSTEKNESLVDISARNESKGIGKFSEVVLAELDSKMAEEGQVVYSRMCSGCHSLGSSKLVGPGLEKITHRRTPEWIMNMMLNPEDISKKDALGKALLKEYRSQMVYQGLTDQEIRNVLEYLRQNDAGK